MSRSRFDHELLNLNGQRYIGGKATVDHNSETHGDILTEKTTYSCYTRCRDNILFGVAILLD